MRALIEERAAQLAVPCSLELLKKLRNEVNSMKRARRNRDADGYADAAVHFHRELVLSSGNKAFLQAWDTLQWQVRARIAVMRVLSAGGDLKDFVEAHAVILKALDSGDGRQAGKLLRELITKLLLAITPAPEKVVKIHI